MEQLLAGAQQLLGLELTPNQRRAFQTYYQELADWDTRFNLTAITDHSGTLLGRTHL